MLIRTVMTIALVLLVGPWAGSANADWSQDPTENNPVCTEPGGKSELRVSEDDYGGMFVVWEDDRSGDPDIYAQYVDDNGNTRWAAGGVAVCVEAYQQFRPDVVSDGAGGAIIAWKDNRLDNGVYQVYAQRLSPNGTPLWTANGRLICNREFNQSDVSVVSDGDGGAIISWADFSGGLLQGIHAQRVNSTGTALWAADGVVVCDETGNQSYPKSDSDGSGGAVFVWRDGRWGSDDTYAQRIDGSGTVLWDPAGMAVCTAAGYQYLEQVAADGSGGALFTWKDERDGNEDIYAQRVAADGLVQWTADGVAICTTPEMQTKPMVTTDGSGGAIISWTDTRNGLSDIYAQRINALGGLRWDSDGNVVCQAVGSQTNCRIVADGDGGAVIAWRDLRNGNSNIFAQKVNESGMVQWTADGVAVTIASGEQIEPFMVADGGGGAVMAWEDQRDSGTNDIYAQWVDADGTIGGPVDNTPPVAEAAAAPNYGFADLYVQFTSSSWDADNDNLEYLWDFGDPGSPSNTSTDEHPRHIYENAGHYSAWLTVSDGEDEDSCSIPITVLAPTISAGLTCTPESGTVPFSLLMRTTIRNERDDQYRRAAGQVDILLANGSFISNWRAGATTLTPGEIFSTQWSTMIPATGSVIGTNRFFFMLEDVTSPPYNQPPYAPSGDMDSLLCDVTAVAP